ncbi:MAG: group II intron reverse transcriptase/maturase, partial [Collinsella sp.]|nr:group II intron reverse transcriptase/maturase [Collinsella sp.]
MRNPIHVLKSLEEKASVSNNKYERLYRNLYNPEFYLLAYANIAKSQGSMTQGVDGQTLDNMSLPRINRIIESIRNRTYQPKPAKRKYIPKKNGKLRPLGITSTDDKLVQEVVRMILEAIYEPTFSNNSHGFRPKRSCHTALTQVKKNFTGVTWIVEGDIKACFDNFDHHVLVELLRKRISDEAFIGLIWKFLKAGYMEQWRYHRTYCGTPQGSGISPILANIYLHELDMHMEEYKTAFVKGNRLSRKVKPEYARRNREVQAYKRRNAKIWNTLTEAEKKERAGELRRLRERQREIPSKQFRDE